MPIHDWTRVETAAFHDFHTTWLIGLKNTLNSGVLPEGYFAYAERHMGRFTSDILTLSDSPPGSESRVKLKGGTRSQTRSLAIRQEGSRRLVALIEIVSASNKSSLDNVAAFVRKARAALDADVHLVLLDILPPTKFAPIGLSGELCDAIQAEPYPFDANKPLAADSFQAGNEVDIYANPLGVGDELPFVPLFLNAGTYVDLPLSETYASAMTGLATPDRLLLAQPLSYTART